MPRNGGLGTASHIWARHRQSPFDSILPSVRPSPPFLVWCQSGREFSKPSNQEYLTHPESPERKTLNPKKWFQETWGPEHVGECRSGLHPLSSLDSPWTYEVLGWWDKPHFRQPASALSLSLALIFYPLCPCSILRLTFYSHDNDHNYYNNNDVSLSPTRLCRTSGGIQTQVSWTPELWTTLPGIMPVITCPLGQPGPGLSDTPTQALSTPSLMIPVICQHSRRTQAQQRRAHQTGRKAIPISYNPAAIFASLWSKDPA